MALNLVGIVLLDRDSAPSVKYPVLGLHVVSYLAYTYSFVLEQKYYSFQGILRRHRPYDNKVWEETNPNVLLWKLGGTIGRSASGAMGLFGTEYARLCLMGFIIFRTQDTWADVCLDEEDRIQGLKLLPKRLAGLLQEDETVIGVPDDYTHKNNDEGGCPPIRWDFDSRPRNRMYVDITLNIHRFDTIFLALPQAHKDILVEYANKLADGWIELEHRKEEPVTSEIMRKHAEVALDAGFFGMCKGAEPELVKAIDPASKNKDAVASTAYVAFSDACWYMNLAATIEEDVAEGVTLDEELRAMNGCLQEDVVKRVRIKWLIKALTHLGSSRAFIDYPKLVNSWSLRFFILQFLKTIVSMCGKYTLEYQGGVFKKSGGKEMFRTFVESLYMDTYNTSVGESLCRAEDFLGQLHRLEQGSSKKLT